MTAPSPESDGPIRLAVIIGSVRTGRFGPTAAHWYVGAVADRDDVVVDTIDLLEADLSPRLDGNPDDPHDQLVWWGRALRDARARRPYGS